MLRFKTFDCVLLMLQPSGAALPLSLDAAMTMGEEQYDNIPDVGEKIDVETMNTNCIFISLLSFILSLLSLGYLTSFLKTTTTSAPTPSPPP